MYSKVYNRLIFNLNCFFSIHNPLINYYFYNSDCAPYAFRN
jgi:hypothetical protein